MMAVELEGLEFQIEAKSNNASKGIDALINSFTRLKSSLSGKGLEKVSASLDSISKSVNESGIGRLESLANALNTLNSVRISPTIPKRLEDIGTALESITSEGIDRAERLSVALQGMDGVNIPNLNGLRSTDTSASGGGDTGGTGAQDAPDDVADSTDEIIRATNAAQVLKNVLKGIGGVFSKTFSVLGRGALKSLQLALKGIGTAAKAAISAGKNLAYTFGSRMAAKVKQTTSTFGKLFASIKRIAMYRLICFMFSQLTKAIKDGINNLYQYSLLMDGTFSKSMDRCATSFLYLKNSMGAMIAPLINSIAPALDFIIDKVVNLFNMVNQLFARLSGANTYTAAKKMATSYAESAEDAANKTKKAAKEIKNATGSIDELNIIKENDNSGNGKEVPDYGSMFEELPISDTISEFADKLKLAIELQNWEELGKLLGNKFNEIINGIDWAGIGRKIGNFLDGAVKTAYHFLKTADFYGLGRHLATLINNALAEIDGEYIGRLLVRSFTAGLDILIGLMDGLDWALLGRTVGNAIQGAISEAYEWLKKVGDFSRFGKYIATGINNALSVIDCEMLGRTIVKILTTLPDILIGLIKNLNWRLVGKSIGDFIKGALNETSDWLKKVDWSQLAHDIYNGIKNCFVGLDFTGIAQAFFRLLGSALGASVSFIATFISDVITDIKNYFLKYIQDENGDGKFGGIEIIKGLLLGIWDGIKNIGTWIKENVFDPFIQGFKDCFGIHSPSTVMREMGKYIVEGFLEGLNLFATIGSKVKEWAGKIIEWFTKGQDGKGLVENFKELAGNIVSSFKDKIGSTYTTVKSVVITWATNVKNWFTNSSFGGVNMTTFQTFANNIIMGFREKVSGTYTTVKNSIVTWASSVKDWFTNSSFGGVNSNTFSTFAHNVVEGFRTKISSAYTTVKTSITTWANSVKNWFTNSSFGGVNSNTFSTFAHNVIEGFRTKISSAYTNTKSCITTWATNLKDWFTGSSHGGINNNTFQTFANNVIEGFRTKISSAYTNTKSCITTWASNVKDWFTGSSHGAVNNYTFQTFANNIITGFKDKISSAYSNTKSCITTWATNVKNWFSDIASKSAFGNFASDVISGFKDKISSTYSTVQSSMTTWANSVKTWFSNIASKSAFTTLASDIVSGFKNGISNTYSTVQSAITTWASSVKSWFTNTCSSSSFYSIASDVVSGFKNGIGALYSTCKNTINSWGSSIIDWFKKKLDSNSPSKVFEQIGKDSVLGYNLGIQDLGKSTKNVVGNWADSFTSIAPALALAVDTSALGYLDTAQFSKSISANVQSSTDITADGFEEAMENFYREYVQPTLNQIADDMRRQADKDEHPIVQVGNRVITDAVETQKKANGYSFTK